MPSPPLPSLWLKFANMNLIQHSFHFLIQDTQTPLPTPKKRSTVTVGERVSTDLHQVDAIDKYVIIQYLFERTSFFGFFKIPLDLVGSETW